MEVKQTSVEHPKKQLNSTSDKCVCAHILLHAQQEWSHLEKYSEIQRTHFTIKIVQTTENKTFSLEMERVPKILSKAASCC